MGKVKSPLIRTLQDYFARAAQIRHASMTLDATKKLLEAAETSLYDTTELQASIYVVEEEIAETRKWISERQAGIEQLIGQFGSIDAKTYARLHYVSGLQWCEISQLSGLNEDAVKKKVYRELQKFTINDFQGGKTI